jgi:hypothetical protein
MRRILTIALTALCFCVVPRSFSQDLSSSNPNFLEVPAGDGNWTIQIVTTGGFDGRGKGNVTVSSFGKLLCSLTVRSCPDSLTTKTLQPLTQMLAAANPASWNNPGDSAILAALCNDCYTTRVILSRREAGQLQVVSFTWNDVTRNNIPSDVLRMTDLAFSLAIPQKVCILSRCEKFW